MKRPLELRLELRVKLLVKRLQMIVVIFVEVLVSVGVESCELLMHLKSIVWSTTCASFYQISYLGKLLGSNLSATCAAARSSRRCRSRDSRSLKALGRLSSF